MKKLFAIGLFLLSGSILFAQEDIVIKNGNESYGEVGNKESVIISVPYSNLDDVSKALKKELKDWKGKVSNDGNEYFADDATLKEMGDNTFDAYAKAFKDVDGTIFVSVAVNLGGTFMSESAHPDKYRVIKKRMYEFAKSAASKGIDNQVKEAEGVKKDHEKELKGLEKDKEDYEEDIVEKENEIKELKTQIETNVTNQGETKKKIEYQESTIKELKELKTKIK